MYWSELCVSVADAKLRDQTGWCVWVTGLPRCGESTVSKALLQVLRKRGEGGNISPTRQRAYTIKPLKWKIELVFGVDVPYEEPVKPEVAVDSDKLIPVQCASRIFETLSKLFLANSRPSR